MVDVVIPSGKGGRARRMHKMRFCNGSNMSIAQLGSYTKPTILGRAFKCNLGCLGVEYTTCGCSDEVNSSR